ncbi:MAG: PAS domain-containing protein, partial [Nitrosospira sp.]|nr:PAS domain-containing protein [Nitrosospira sp.]
MSVTDRSGRILQANPKFCEVSGYSEAELIGQDHRILNSGTHPKAFFVDMWATIARGEVWHREICNRSKSGQLYWVDSTIVPLKDKDQTGKITGYLSVRVDITARKHKELALQERLKESVCLHAI